MQQAHRQTMRAFSLPRKKSRFMAEKQIRILSIIATFTAVAMYVSYIPQIQLNLSGQKGSAIQPFCAAVNCTLWVIYGLFKKPRDLPLAIANAPGVVLGILAGVTAL